MHHKNSRRPPGRRFCLRSSAAPHNSPFSIFNSQFALTSRGEFAIISASFGTACRAGRAVWLLAFSYRLLALDNQTIRQKAKSSKLQALSQQDNLAELQSGRRREPEKFTWTAPCRGSACARSPLFVFPHGQFSGPPTRYEGRPSLFVPRFVSVRNRQRGGKRCTRQNDVADFLTEPPKECGSTLKW